MKYVKKLPETDQELSAHLQKAGWIKIKEPANLPISVLLSLPFAFLLTSSTAYIAYDLKPALFDFITPESFAIQFTIDLKFVMFFISIWIYMLIHEMIHAMFIPQFVKSEKTKWGINGLFGFVFTTEPIKKERYLIISCMPFIILSILALLVFNLIGILNIYTLLLCLLNAMGSCVDFLNIVIISFQVKPRRTIINNGFETYYSPEEIL
jgi:hypothetical protein